MTQITTIRVSEHIYAQGEPVESPVPGYVAVKDGPHVYVGKPIESVRK